MRDLVLTSKALASKVFGAQSQGEKGRQKWPLWASVTLIIGLSVVLWGGLIALALTIWGA